MLTSKARTSVYLHQYPLCINARDHCCSVQCSMLMLSLQFDMHRSATHGSIIPAIGGCTCVPIWLLAVLAADVYAAGTAVPGFMTERS